MREKVAYAALVLFAMGTLLLISAAYEYAYPELQQTKEAQRIARANAVMTVTTTVMQLGVVTEGIVIVVGGITLAAILLSVGVASGSLAAISVFKARRVSLEARMIYPDAHGAFPIVYEPPQKALTAESAQIVKAH